MTNIDKIIDFMWWKNEQLKKHTDVVFFTKEDEDDLRKNMTDEDVLDFMKEIQYWVIEYNIFSDCNLCPFCFLYFDDEYCPTCGYGKRHGCCLNDDSDYEKIAREENLVCLITAERIKEYIENNLLKNQTTIQ